MIILSEFCIQCGKCITRCPVKAIKEIDDKYVIDNDKCVDCGACYDGCPADAIC